MPTKAWSRPEELRARLRKQWQSQRLLKEWLQGELALPVRLPIRGPSPRDLRERFAEANAWADDWQHAGEDEPFRLEMQTVNNQRMGRQTLPRQLVLTDETALFGWIGELEAFSRFRQLVERLGARWPQCRATLASQPFRLLELAPRIDALCAVLAWFETHPRPDRYLRELEIPGVDTKFIENNRQLIHDLLLTILPPDRYDASVAGLAQHGFERKFGLRYDPATIRFRLLDQRLALGGLTDLNVPLAQFSQLRLPVTRVFITENKINGLAFPPQDNALVIFGLGYGVDQLGRIDWLKEKQIHYWGDIDSHGFNILAQLRKQLPQTRSLLMDEATLLELRELWVDEPQPQRNFDTGPLTAEEATLLDALWQQRWGHNLRLEQERIPFSRLQRYLQQLDQPRQEAI